MNCGHILLGWYSDLFNDEDFNQTDADMDDDVYGRSAWRKRDALPIDNNRPQIIKFGELNKTKELSDIYEWFGDFFLISSRLKNFIEEMDPGSLDCLETSSHDRALEEPYWVCLPRRNLEAVDTTKTSLSVLHEEYETSTGEPYFTQLVMIRNGAFLDSTITKGPHNFWDVDLHAWIWSRELVARAHLAGMQGIKVMRTGKPINGRVDRDELHAICADFAD